MATELKPLQAPDVRTGRERKPEYRPRTWSLWWRWVTANAWGELVGLGSTLGIGAMFFSGLGEEPGVTPALLAAALMTATGALEGLIVGLAQWSVLRLAIAGLARRTWVIATVLGAVIAWFLGSIPMTIGALSSNATATPVEEPPQAVVLVFAVALGLVAGLVLSLLQWTALKTHVFKAWRWLPANAVAWAVGMPLVFLGIDLAQRVSQLSYAILVVAGTIAITGAAVGAIHGLVLVRFVPRRDS